MSVEGESRVLAMEKMLKAHCQKEGLQFEQLKPLIELIPTIKEIIERENEQKAVSRWMVRIGKLLGFMAGVVTALGIIAGAAALVIKAMFFIK